MDIYFSFDGNIDPVATYAAILSSAIAILEWIKWKGKNAVILRCNSNMILMPSSDRNKYIIATVTNTGEAQTTITHFLAYYWSSKIDKLLNRGKKAFIINARDVPAIIQPGQQWTGQVIQCQEMEKMAKNGLLYIGIIHSMSEKEVIQRVIIENSSNLSAS